MSNERIRERMKRFTEDYPVSYIKIGYAIGLGEPSRYLISRFLKGRTLNDETLKQIDNYLIAKGYWEIDRSLLDGLFIFVTNVIKYFK